MTRSHVESRWQLVGVAALTGLAACTACNVLSSKESAATSRVDGTLAPRNPAEGRALPKPVANSLPPAVVAAFSPTSLPKIQGHADRSKLQIKRFVVASAVKDREPLVSRAALPGDGSAIYAFAELANPAGSSENVRITFERKAGTERVGDVTLPVPANVSRHRTWAFTRFIRAAGVWEAVLWAEDGTELGRTSFGVTVS